MDIAQIKDKIAKLNARIDSWRWAPEDLFPKLVDDISGVLEVVCTFYLNATPGDRQQIRKTILKHKAVRFHLFTFLHTATQMLQANRDSKWLYLGLAAASIENLEEDARDTYRYLGELFVAATKVGLDPVPYFKEVASKSSQEVKGLSHESMQYLLANFHQSPYFEKDLKPEMERQF